MRTAFQDREVFPQWFPASVEEEEAYDTLLAVPIAGREPGGAGRDLFTVTLEKSLFSSPAACLETVKDRIRRREHEIAAGRDIAPRQAEVAGMNALRLALERIAPATYAKYQALLTAIRTNQPLDWKPDDATDRSCHLHRTHSDPELAGDAAHHGTSRSNPVKWRRSTAA